MNTPGGYSYSNASVQVEVTDSASFPERQPRIAFHSGGRAASQIGFLRTAPTGEVSVIDNPGTGYEKFGASSITAYAGAEPVQLKPGGVDHVYLGWYPRTSAPGSRGGYAGFGSAATNNLTIANEISGGNVNITTVGAGFLQHNGARLWTQANDGVGSGLDADLLDGLDSSAFVRKANDFLETSFVPGSLTVNANAGLSLTNPLSGAAIGDYVMVSMDTYPSNGVAIYARVLSAGNVAVVFTNGTASSVTWTPGTVYVRLVKKSW
ncbi:MAG: hypothetical protein HC933_10305 [Pleurocapsa sp. SU_196_0]|nr:hypothetical protein [Pleurocapsa sp. SU_196_0]